MPLITVFTPSYNRAELLPRLYRSLCKQTFRDFEWLVVDDGSSDNTKETINRFKSEETFFPIRYYKKDNGGKHTAINMGVKLAKGELFFIADSDDMLPADSLDTVCKYWNQIKEDKTFAGICGLDKSTDNHIIGSGLPKDIIDGSLINVRFGMKIKGDMKEVLRTSVLSQYPFPEINGEKFCPEILVWNRIGLKYQMRYFSKVIYIADYQKNGITSNIVKQRMNSPIATTLTYQEMTSYNAIPTTTRLRAAINYWRFWFCIDNQQRPTAVPALTGKMKLLKPFGWLYHQIDKWQTR